MVRTHSLQDNDTAEAACPACRKPEDTRCGRERCRWCGACRWAATLHYCPDPGPAGVEEMQRHARRRQAVRAAGAFVRADHCHAECTHSGACWVALRRSETVQARQAQQAQQTPEARWVAGLQSAPRKTWAHRLGLEGGEEGAVTIAEVLNRVDEMVQGVRKMRSERRMNDTESTQAIADAERVGRFATRERVRRQVQGASGGHEEMGAEWIRTLPRRAWKHMVRCLHPDSARVRADAEWAVRSGEQVRDDTWARNERVRIQGTEADRMILPIAVAG